MSGTDDKNNAIDMEEDWIFDENRKRQNNVPVEAASDIPEKKPNFYGVGDAFGNSQASSNISAQPKAPEAIPHQNIPGTSFSNLKEPGTSRASVPSQQESAKTGNVRVIFPDRVDEIESLLDLAHHLIRNQRKPK